MTVGTSLFTFCSLIIPLLTHVFCVRFIENLCFLIGSAYFVSGSYPDGSMVIDDDFLSTSIHSEIEDGFYLKVKHVVCAEQFGLAVTHIRFYLHIVLVACNNCHSHRIQIVIVSA